MTETKTPFNPELLADDFFRQCLGAAASNKELVAQFDRLTGHNLSRTGKPIELMVDDACGRTETALRDFVAFVRDCIYERLKDYKAPDPHAWGASLEGDHMHHPFLTVWKCRKCGTTCVTHDGTGEVPGSDKPCKP